MFILPSIEKEKSTAFNAPIYHIQKTTSTMDEAKKLASANAPDGTVIYTDFQTDGRGRVEGRKWTAEPKENLLCTVLLRRPPPAGFTLRVGLAVARTFDHFLHTTKKTQIKWPNDVLYEGKKISGVLCENDGSVLYVGTGLNIGTDVFPPELIHSASSLALILQSDEIPLPSIKTVLDVYLSSLSKVLNENDWNTEVSKKLYQRGEKTTFLVGDPKNNESIVGVIEGIGNSGELLFLKDGSKPEDPPVHLFSGEIQTDHPLHQ